MPVIFPSAALRTALSLAGLLLATFVLTYVAVPDSDVFLGAPGSHALIALPHGAKILIAWMMGWTSVAVVLPVTLLFKLVMAHGHILPADLIMSVLGALAGPVAFDLFLWAGFDLRRNSGQRMRWQAMTLVALVASFLKLFCACLLMQACQQATATPLDQLLYVAGDTAGVVALLLGLMFLFRFQRRFA